MAFLSHTAETPPLVRPADKLDTGPDVIWLTKTLELSATLQLTLRLVRERWRAYYLQYGLAISLMFVVAGTTAASAWLMSDVINRIFVDKDKSSVFWIPLLIIAIFTAKGLSGYYQEVILTRVGNRLVADTQKQMFDHLLAMDVQYYQDHPSSDLITRITYSAGSARDMLNMLFVGLGRDLLTLLSLIGVMVFQDPVMCAIALLVGPVVFLSLRRLTALVKKATTSEVSSMANIIGVMRETTQGIKIVKSFQLEGGLRRQMYDAIDAVMRMSNKIVSTQARVNPLIDTLGGVAVALVVLYAGWRNLANPEAPGHFFAFVTALLMASDPARRISRLQLALATTTIGVKMMFDLLDTPAGEAVVPKEAPLTVSKGAITFDTVDFSYGPGTPVLKQLSLTAKPGQTTALVGTSGGGKTTVLNLLQRFWLPQGGRILIDGQDIGVVALASLRRQITYVSQDVFLFEGTIRDNIRSGKGDATDGEIERAAEQAHAASFIKTLSHGYDTRVGELGTQLSGGQRQRISMARAFLKDAPIILLDEPTSALDSESEQIIQAAIKELTRGKTTVVIAHRLSTVMRADVICVIEGGVVAESGTHAELVRGGGMYARLHGLQFAA